MKLKRASKNMSATNTQLYTHMHIYICMHAYMHSATQPR